MDARAPVSGYPRRRSRTSRAWNRTGASDGQRDLSQRVALLQALVGGPNIGQGEAAVDDRLKAAGEHQAHDGGKFGPGAHGGPDQAQVFGKHVTVVKFQLWAGRVAHGENS